MVLAILKIYAPMAFTIFAIGTLYRILKHVVLTFTRRRPMGPTPTLDIEEKISWFEAFRRVIFTPVMRYPKKHNPLWSWAFGLYHIGIIMTSAGYALAGAILFYHIANGHPVPDLTTGVEVSNNYSIVNIMALIFGDGEAMVAKFLFGSYAATFITITWIDVGFAATGNFLMLIVRILGLNGAVTRDVDRPAEGARIKGYRPTLNSMITVIITCIIWTELLARLGLVHDIVFVHAILGSTLLMLFPFTYLFHMLYIVVAFYYAAARRRTGTIA